MISSPCDRSRRIAAACVLAVAAVVVGVLALTVGVGVPHAWWPDTGRAFAADTRPTNDNPCAPIAGPAKDYCERGTRTTASVEKPGGAGAAWRLVPAGAGVAALVVWRRRSSAGRRRR
ncbi:hypothetical protein [Streptomyces sp. NBC_01092]|uniref:hypothetical protein n=1 Tax=Streptomyces sp. NBC_01092 TaxID=2903748 RepID=UPI003870AF55|nr:hypothetical protein OG254_00265 [Streptomyces sp. NBC_01092]WSU55726.1 hypothetical protein OG254_49160 [Streptomyces sp. NBC_01092]